jgi:hypothetical protein
MVDGGSGRRVGPSTWGDGLGPFFSVRAESCPGAFCLGGWVDRWYVRVCHVGVDEHILQ